MSELQFLKARFSEYGDHVALVWRDREFSYSWLSSAISQWLERLADEAVQPKDVVSLSADFSPSAIALLLALAEHGSTVVPLTSSIGGKRDGFLETAKVSVDISILPDDTARFTKFDTRPSHTLFDRLWQNNRPGLILFSSGSTGKSKAALHDFQNILDKFKTRRHAKCTLAFLLFDHIGGLNTLLHVLSNGGTVVTVADRSSAAVCHAIEKYRVQILPTSPTFLNLLLMSGAGDAFDLSSIETITYGTEVMPQSTLVRLQARFPQATLLQTYGLSEVGILRSRSESSSSLWVKIGGEGFETRVANGMLEIKSSSAMLGYLNADSPFTDDGWFMTGDVVEERDGYFRIFGRKSELINIGGDKVFPAEIENVLLQMDGVEDVLVYGEPHAIVGNLVVAKINVLTNETTAEFRKRMVLQCGDLLEAFKLPQKILLSRENFHGERFKKNRAV